MAIDFPNSPTLNQIFTSGTRSWQWDGTTWNIYAAKPVISVQDSAPTSPSSGDQWYESDTGRWFLYYDSVWVEIGNSNDVGQTPPGVISQYAGSTAPTGWLICDGTAVSRSTYASLFSVLSTTYGVGDGSTTFNLPDLRTRVPVGKNSSGTFTTLGATGGAETHTLTVAQIPAAEVRVDDGSGTLYGLYGATGGSSPGYLGRPSTEFPNASSAGRRPATINGGGGSHNILQPYIVLNYIIKA